MRRMTSLSLGSLGILALLGCHGSDGRYGHTSGYLVNAITVADTDGNNLPDILGLVSTEYDGRSTQGYVSTRLQTSANAFAMPLRFGVGTDPANLVAKDLNGDNRPDLVVANAWDGTVSVRLADATRPGYFLPAVVLNTPGRYPMDVAVGEFNGDGRMDIVVAASGANSVLVFTQTATPGTFNALITSAVGGDPQAVTVADLNGDGRADVAAATTANTVSVLLQTTAGTFAPAVDHTTGVQPIAVQAADLNGDGRLDLLTANYGAALSPGFQGLSVLFQAASGTFAAPVHHDTGYRASALAVGNLNGDARPDVAVACAGLPGDPGAVSVFLQDTTPGTLLPSVDYLGTWGPMGVALADMDDDGHLDLVLADGDIVVRYNTSTAPGTFGRPTFFYH